VAVNSGSSKSEVEAFAKETKFEWPILVDQTRAFEKAYLPTEISLQNIYQARLITPEGRVQNAPFRSADAKPVVEAQLASAKLFFDGVTVHPKLKSFAEDVELGYYESGIPPIAAAQKAAKDLGESAKALYEKVRVLADAKVARAKELEGAGSKYGAWVEYGQVAAWFKGTEYEKPAAAAQAELKKDKSVQEELAAQQLLAQAKTLLSSGKKADKPAAAGLLAALQKKYPASEAAKEAAKLSESAK
jgi:hypothetical protein